MIEYDPMRPKWVQIAETLRERIRSGEYPPKTLISEFKLESDFEVSRITARKATAALREEGLIVTVRGMGSFVAPPEDWKPPADSQAQGDGA